MSDIHYITCSIWRICIHLGCTYETFYRISTIFGDTKLDSCIQWKSLGNKRNTSIQFSETINIMCMPCGNKIFKSTIKRCSWIVWYNNILRWCGWGHRRRRTTSSILRSRTYDSQYRCRETLHCISQFHFCDDSAHYDSFSFRKCRTIPACYEHFCIITIS